MNFTLNPRFLHELSRPGGPIDRVVKTRAENVEERARENASFAVIGIVTGQLHDRIATTPSPTPDGSVAYVVGTDAQTPGGFSYPGYWNVNGRPWLSLALAEEFKG